MRLLELIQLAVLDLANALVVVVYPSYVLTLIIIHVLKNVVHRGNVLADILTGTQETMNEGCRSSSAADNFAI